MSRWLAPYRWGGVGGPPHERAWLVHAFSAKRVYEFPTTCTLFDALAARPTLRRLCGWDRAAEVPHESTFSRAFAAFAEQELPQQLHAALIPTPLGPHRVSPSAGTPPPSTAAKSPRPPSPPAPPASPRKRGRPAQGEVRPPPPPKQLDLQGQRTLAENLADLPHACDVGCKRNSKGHQASWLGFQLHLDLGSSIWNRKWFGMRAQTFC